MEKVHSSHQGIEGCSCRAREVFYWPRMNAELEDFILKCDVCNSYKPEQPREPLMPHEIPSRPWQKVGTDLLQFDGRQYLITIDYYSSFFEVDKLVTTDSRTVMEYRRLSFLTTAQGTILRILQSLQKTGISNTLPPCLITPKATERLRVLLKSVKIS